MWNNAVATIALAILPSSLMICNQQSPEKLVRVDLCFDIDTNNSDRAKVVGYVERVAKIALKLSRFVGVPPSIILAQAVLESRAGQSVLATQGNNHFGIKFYSIQMYPTTHIKLCVQDSLIRFCRYANHQHSFIHHTLLLAYRYPELLRCKDTEKWLKALETTYCTTPDYKKHLAQIIKMYKLDRYDNICLTN